MTDESTERPPTSTLPEENPLGGFFSNILTPGSSLSPTFLWILNASFAALLSVFLLLLFLTRGSVHILFLIAIEGCLWASVKWFVSELQKAQAEEATKVGSGAQSTGPTERRRKED